MENLYKLDGKVPILKAILFGLKHILAMFVANLSPITLIGLASSLKAEQKLHFYYKMQCLLQEL